MAKSNAVKLASWTLLTAVGLAGGLIAGLLVGMPLGQIFNAMIVTAAVTCVVGGVLGSMQAVYLRQLLTKPIWWIVATILGLGVGLAAGVVLIEQIGILVTGSRPNVAHLTAPMRALSFLALGLVSGTFLGVAQWLVLRRQASGVKYWVPTIAIALAIAFCVSSLLTDLSGLRFATAPGLVMFVLASGLAFGALSSWPLLRAH